MKTKVYIFRGFGGEIFSTGMDRLGEKIKDECKNVEVVVDRYESYIKHFPDIKDSAHSVLIGHSFGALACYKIVSLLKHKKFPLVISFDCSPYYSGVISHPPDGIVPANVIKVINFYQEVDPLVRGVRMERVDKSENGIINIRREMAHVEIDKSDELHQISIKNIKAL